MTVTKKLLMAKVEFLEDDVRALRKEALRNWNETIDMVGDLKRELLKMQDNERFTTGEYPKFSLAINIDPAKSPRQVAADVCDYFAALRCRDSRWTDEMEAEFRRRFAEGEVGR